MKLCYERAGALRQQVKKLLRPPLVDQNITAIASFDRLVRRIGIAGDDNTTVWGVESVSVTLHSVFRGERGHRDLGVFVDHAGLDFMRIHLPAVRDTALQSVRICTRFN